MPDEDTHVLVDLARHPGFALLRTRLEQRHRRDVESVAAQLVAGELVDQRVLDKRHGFWLGGRWLLREAEHELRSFRDRTREEE